ncbi:16883_t:CDS:1, partial [Gigaspora margarita]
AQQNSGSFPIPFPSNRLGGLSKSTPQPSVHGGENQIKAPPNPAEAMLPSHNKVTDQSAVTTTPQPTHPKTDSLPKTSTAVASNTPKPSGVTAGNTTTSSSNCHVINGIGLHLVFASGMIGIFVWLGGHSF